MNTQFKIGDRVRWHIYVRGLPVATCIGTILQISADDSMYQVERMNYGAGQGWFEWKSSNDLILEPPLT